MKPADFRLGSIESRAAARRQLDWAESEIVLRVRIVHIGRDGTTPLPASRRIVWQGGASQIVHVAGTKL
jgi:hypothetical protein